MTAGPRRAVLALGLALLCCRAARAAETCAKVEESTSTEKSGLMDSLSFGVRGSVGREANSRDYDWGPTLDLGMFTSEEKARTRFKYELEYSYNDAHWKLISDESTQKTRVKVSELKYAKLSLLKAGGRDLKKTYRLVPYVSGGVQYVDSTEETFTPANAEEETPQSRESTRDIYWAPTWGVGVLFSLGQRTSLGLDFEQNVAGGNRRISRLSFELKFDVFGSDEE